MSFHLIYEWKKEEYAEDDKSLRYGVFDFEKVSNVIKTAWEA